MSRNSPSSLLQSLLVLPCRLPSGARRPLKRSSRMEVAEWTARGAANQTQAGAAHTLAHLLRDSAEGRNSSSPPRALRLPDGTSAAWYILTIFGIYAVVFLFRLASNILRKNDKSLEDIYYLNLTSELKKKGLPSRAAKCSTLTISNTAALQPRQASLGPGRRDSGPHTEI